MSGGRRTRLFSGIVLVAALVGASVGSATASFGAARPAQTGAIVLNGGLVSVNLTTPGETGSFTFSGTTGQAVSALLTSSTFAGCPTAVTVALVRPDTTPLASASTCTDTALLDHAVLDQTGTWTVRVTPANNGTGSASLQAFDSTDQTHAITIGGAPVNVNLKWVGQNGTYTFTGTKGQQISAQMSVSTLAGCPAYLLSLVRPNGTTLGTARQGCDATAFFDTQTLDKNGTWTIRVDPQGTATGTAKLNAYPASPLVKPITVNGKAVNVSLPQPGENASLTFSGTAGQGVSAQVTAGTFTGCPAFEAYLVRPNGSQFGTVGSTCTDTLFLDPQTLDATGTWTIVVDPQGATTGTATVQAFESADQVEPITVNGAAANVNLGPGQQGSYTFTGATGQLISAQVTNSTFAGCTAYTLQLRRPDLSPFGTPVNGCDATAFLDTVTLDQNGTWAFVFEPQSETGGSALLQAYTFTDQTGPAADLAGKNTKLVIAKPGQNARITFSGTSGHHISAYVSQSTMTGCSAFTVALVRPNGTTLGSPASTCTDNAFLETQALDATGTWTVLVDPQGPANGTAVLQVYDVVDVTPSIKPGGPIKSFTTTARGLNAHFRFTGTAGDSRTVTITGSTFAGCPGLAVSFVRPDGSVLSTTTTCNGNLTLGPSVLDVSGKWTILVDPQGPAKGTLIIKVT